MSVTSIRKDTEQLTMTVTAEYDVTADRAWQLWADPRQLERWWGPPTYPATFEEHDLAPGGEVTYFMTGSEGDRPRGWWRVTSVDPPTSLRFTDGFANDDGTPNDEMPVMTVEVRLSERDNGTRMEIRSTYESREEMDTLIEMGALEGMQQAVGQMDALLGARTGTS